MIEVVGVVVMRMIEVGGMVVVVGKMEGPG